MIRVYRGEVRDESTVTKNNESTSIIKIEWRKTLRGKEFDQVR